MDIFGLMLVLSAKYKIFYLKDLSPLVDRSIEILTAQSRYA